jgi:hypothetical protein
MSVPATGNDTNDGTAPETAKGTPAGIQALLNSVDNRGHKITVRWSGKIGTTSSEWTMVLPGYNDRNLEFVGESTETDGYLGTIYVWQGVFTANNLAFGRLYASIFGGIRMANKKIRLTGVATPADGIVGDGKVQFAQSEIEYSGAFTGLFYGGYDNFDLLECKFTQIGSPVYIYFCKSGRMSVVLFTSPVFEGDAQPTSGYTCFLASGSGVYGLTSAFPGGGTVSMRDESRIPIAARGTARAGGQVAPDGALPKSFGITSVTKTATGIYQIVHNLTNTVVLVSVKSSAGMGSIVASGDNNTTTVRTFNASGALADTAFNIAIF